MWRVVRQSQLFRGSNGGTSAGSHRNREAISSNTPAITEEVPRCYIASTGTAAVIALIAGLNNPMYDKRQTNSEQKESEVQHHNRKGKKCSAKYLRRQQKRYNHIHTSNLGYLLQRYQSSQRRNIVYCEKNESESIHPNGSLANVNDSSGSKNTFRRRRLTLHSNSSDRITDTSNQHDHIHPSTSPSKMQVMYSAEIDEDDDEEKEAMLQQHQLFVRRNTKSHPLMESKQYKEKAPPFSKDQVGTFSCHGIEPLSYIVDDESYNTNQNNVNGNAFLSSFLGSSSPSRPTIRTLTEHKTNQDRGHVVYPYANQPKMALFGTYDGHGEKGELVAEHTMKSFSDKLHKFIVDAYPSGRTIEGRKHYISKAINNILCDIDNDMKGRPYLHASHSGTTACIVLMNNRTVWVANVGDSRAVLARRRQKLVEDANTEKWKTKSIDGKVASSHTGSTTLDTIQLTKDQNALDEEERARIIKSGGYITMPIEEGLPARVWLDEHCSQIGLAMSRSIGDHVLKKVGVIADPVINNFDLTEEDEFLIIGTDGIWEFISSTEAIKIVEGCFEEGMGASDACKELIHVAMKRWQEKEGDYRDDITAIVVRLNGLWQE